MNIKLIISDFDGTLVDTQKANFHAYQEVLSSYHGIHITEEMYQHAFGMRLNEFMNYIGIHDSHIIEIIKRQKADVYPKYFEYITVNTNLFAFIESMKTNGIPIVLASTAQKINICNVLTHIGKMECFNLIISGTDISAPKPDPECFQLAMRHYNRQPTETLIFEDSAVGLVAAERSGANYIKINPFI